MSWIDEQIRERKRQDQEEFTASMEDLSARIMHRKHQKEEERWEAVQNAVQAILCYYHMQPGAVLETAKTLDEQLDYACRPLGMMRRDVVLESGWYRDAAGAMLGWKSDGTAVALLPDKFGGYYYYDSSAGKKIRLNKTTEQCLQSQAICFYKPFPQKKLGIRDLLWFSVENCPKAAGVLLLAAITAATLVGLLTPKITHLLFSQVVESQSLRLLLSIAVLSVSVTISSTLLNGFRTLLTARLSTQLELSVQAATMARLLSPPADFFRDYSSGELANRVRYVSDLCSAMVSTFLTSGLTALFSLIYISQVFAYTPSLTVPALVIPLITAAVTALQAFLQVKESRKRMEAAGKKDGMSYAMISGIQKIKLSGSETRAFSRWVRMYAQEAEHTYGNRLLLLLKGAAITGIPLIGTVILYWIAVKSGVDVAEYYAFTAAYGVVSGAFLSAVNIGVNGAKLRPVLDMAKPILEAVPENTADKQLVSRLTGSIEISHLSFRYTENMPLIFDDLSLKIRPGQYVAIVGKSGCGKSTLMRLLLGFEKPHKGAIYYDGRDMSTLNLQSLRQHIGSIMQNGKLFHGDIFSNIVICAPWLTLDDAWEAAKIAGLDEDIRAMPMGMHTIISEGGGGLSGGQKQRLMIARAVASKPQVMMLDEATSALDNITQRKVSEALGELKCTRIVIAHRLSTIRKCDRIIVLDGGKIVEDGSYDELMAKKGFFADLVDRQRLSL